MNPYIKQSKKTCIIEKQNNPLRRWCLMKVFICIISYAFVRFQNNEGGNECLESNNLKNYKSIKK